ncbi:28S ribosomal protein S12, mitochondrial-like [Choloepus didactylus]|uniref:28S ribosomal protein S12, mitochondrial-like n=1 Tax=Choloepus didactylus TaxID=27675 RepID=UPI0018A02527|nr:28S ribosomal protein S12, mitochondrial-like [Choloepus didactylus]
MPPSGLFRGLSTFLSGGLALAPGLQTTRPMATVNQKQRLGSPKRPPRNLGPTQGRPQLQGVVPRTFIRKPEKPNSANRKCCRERLSTGREGVCFIPAEGHSLQAHHVVLVQGGRTQDLRGKYNCGHVRKKK